MMSLIKIFKSVTDWLTQWPMPTVSRVAFATNYLDFKNGDNSSENGYSLSFYQPAQA